MNYSKKTPRDITLEGKRVLVRCDFNVPLKEGKITDENRLVAALPTIKKLLEQGAKVILCSHMGRPHNVLNETLKLSKKEKKKIEALPEEERAAATEAALEKGAKDITKLSLAPVAKRLNELLDGKVAFASDIVGPDAQAKVAALKEGECVLLENTRFDVRETKNGADFAKELADYADIYVNDAFGAAHRAHASTAGVAAYLPAVCGYLIGKEIGVMGKALADPERPFVAILGGAKVSDKIGVINNLLEKVDTLIIGGGMAYTFLAAKGYSIGKSLFDETKLDYCKEMMKKAEEKGVKLDVELTADDLKELAEQFKAEYKAKIGSDFPTDPKEQLIGAEAEKEVEVNVTFPEEYHSADLAGKEAMFKCTVHEIKVKELPELDDEFAKDVSEFDTLAELKADIRAKLEKNAEERVKREIEDAAVDVRTTSSLLPSPQST